MKFEKYIDHTLLKPESTRTQIDQIIDEAKAYNFKSVCVNPTHVKYAAERLADSEVLVCTVIGFPLERRQRQRKHLKQKMRFKMVQMKLTWSSTSAH